MKIGIDIDGVLTNVIQFMKEAGSCYARKTGKGKLIDENAHDILDMFGWDEQTTMQFWEENIFDYAKNYPVQPFAKESIEKLKQQGHEIYIMTARIFSERLDQKGIQMRNTVKAWLKKNQIAYDHILFTKGSKMPYCKDYKIEVMIEDTPKNIYEMSKQISVICMEMPYNKQVEGKQIIRCHDWRDVYTAIQLLMKKEK